MAVDPRRGKLLFRFLIPAILLFTVPGSAQFRMGPIQVVVTPDYADWKYVPGENAVIGLLLNKTPASWPG